MRRIERRIRSAGLDAKLLAASFQQIIKAGATLLITKAVFGLLKADEQIFINGGKITREEVDNLKNTVPAFTALRDMPTNIPIQEMRTRLYDAKIVSERTPYRPYFFASGESQLEAGMRVSRQILADGIKNWREAKSRLFHWK